jgi:hypothetical protein
MHRATTSIVLIVCACGGGSEEPDAPTGRPTLLSQAGLYRDFASRELASDLFDFAPTHVLWSDGATKRRFLRLPPGKNIDTSDPDHWVFPVGTQLWKEFSSNGVLVETRLIERTGPGDMDYWMGSFVWRDDESDAEFAELGAQDIRGTDHDAPTAQQCWTCHLGEPGRILGFSAVQLPAATLAQIAPRLSAPVEPYVVPGAPAVSAALGYLHANCGHCHSEFGIARPDTDMILRLVVADVTVADTATCRTTFGQPLTRFHDPAVSLRVAPGDPDASGITFRMATREVGKQMPPLATEKVDTVGLDAVRAWIATNGCAP